MPGLKFWDFQWSGQRWENIEIDPVDQTYFLPLLTHLAVTYGFAMPTVIDTIDGYAADFALLGSNARLQVDAYSFSIALEKKTVRDQVMAELRALPEDYFL